MLLLCRAGKASIEGGLRLTFIALKNNSLFLKMMVRHFLLRQLMPFGMMMIAFAPSGIAANRYISNAGSDAANGQTISTAWKTLAPANNRNFDPGDTLFLMEGQTFAGPLNLTNEDGNTPSRYFVITSCDAAGKPSKAKATIDGGTAYGLYAYNTQGILLSNLRFAGSNDSLGTNWGVLFYAVFDNKVSLQHCDIRDCEVEGFGQGGVFYGGYALGGTQAGFSNCSLSNLDIHGNRENGIYFWAYRDTLNPVGYNHQDITVSGCRIHDNFSPKGSSAGITFSYTKGATIQNNSIYGNGSRNPTAYSLPTGIYTLFSSDILIENNEIYNNCTPSVTGLGITIGGGTIDCKVLRNYLHDNCSAGIYAWSSAEPYQTSDITIAYNISERDAMWIGLGSIYLASTVGTPGLSNITIANNTIYTARRADLGDAACFRAVGPFSGDTSWVVNNVFIADSAAALAEAPSEQPMKMLSNLYYPTDNQYRFFYDYTEAQSAAEWRLVTGNEQINNVVYAKFGSPKFNSLGLGGTLDPDPIQGIVSYLPSKTSATVDAGLDLSKYAQLQGLTRDYLLEPIPSNKLYDLGAIEYQKPTVGISPELVGNLGVYPNPFSDVLHLPSGCQSAELMDMQGRVVRSAGSESQSITTIGLPAGPYALRICSDGNYSTAKLIKE